MAGHDNDHKVDTYRSMIEISRDAFRFLATLNGGTWLAVLTFANRDAKWADVGSVANGVAYFIVSMLLTASCFLTSWATQYCLHNEHHCRMAPKRHLFPMGITAAAYVLAVGAYGRGAWLSMCGLMI